MSLQPKDTSADNVGPSAAQASRAWRPALRGSLARATRRRGVPGRHSTLGPSGRARQRGAALVVGLILLLILTLLAITGMNSATTELIMAGNEQYHRNAAHAASTGIEEAIGSIGNVPTTLGAQVNVAPAPVPGTDPATAANACGDGASGNCYSTRTTYVGDETGLPQSSVNKFIGLHYVIESTGTSARNATDKQVQGVLVVALAWASGDNSFGKIGTGLN